MDRHWTPAATTSHGVGRGDSLLNGDALSSSLSRLCQFFYCPLCCLRYKRVDHFRRHLASHQTTAQQTMAHQRPSHHPPVDEVLAEATAGTLDPAALQREMTTPKFRCLRCQPTIFVFDDQAELMSAQAKAADRRQATGTFNSMRRVSRADLFLFASSLLRPGVTKRMCTPTRSETGRRQPTPWCSIAARREHQYVSHRTWAGKGSTE